MIITKMALPRRTFLRGIGVTLALPMLDAMVPALSAAQTTARPAVPRMAFFYAPNGTFLPNFFPTQAGRGFELTPVLQPLENVRDHIVVVSGLANKGAETMSEGGGVHTRFGTSWLTGVRPKKTEGNDIEAGTSIDQIAAAQIGRTRRCSRCRLRSTTTSSSAAARTGTAACTSAPSRGSRRPHRCRWRAIRARCSSGCSARAARRPSG